MATTTQNSRSKLPLDADETPAGNGQDAGPKARLLTLAHWDGRTAAAKLVRELIASITDDLGGDGQLTEGARQLVQRAGVLGAYIEDAEARWIAGEPFEPNEYLAAINVQRRVLATLGLERRARDITPSLATYIAAKAPDTRKVSTADTIPTGRVLP